MNWQTLIGQKPVKRELQVLAYDDSPFSILLRGPYGYGKTTLAHLYAQTRGRYLYYPIPPSADEISGLGRTVILDEIHLTNKEEQYFPLMQGNRSAVFCTTNTANLSGAFKSRCIQLTLNDYTLDEITSIIMISLAGDGTIIEKSQALELAKRAHLNPRLAIILAKRVYRLVKFEGENFNLNNIIKELELLGIDEHGYDNRHRAYLLYLKKMGTSVGLRTLSTAIGVDEHTLTNEIEPSLISDGKVIITRRGRTLV